MSYPSKYHAYCVDCRVYLRGQPDIHRHLQSRCCLSIWPDKPRNPGFRPGELPKEVKEARKAQSQA